MTDSEDCFSSVSFLFEDIIHIRTHFYPQDGEEDQLSQDFNEILTNTSGSLYTPSSQSQDTVESSSDSWSQEEGGYIRFVTQMHNYYNYHFPVNPLGNSQFFLLSATSLLPLLSKCHSPGCGDSVAPGDMSCVQDGAALIVNLRCEKGHKNTWHSSEGVTSKGARVSYINILMVVYIFLTGLHFGTIKVELSVDKPRKNNYRDSQAQLCVRSD